MAKLKWYNLLQFTSLLLVAVMIPVDWHNGSTSLWSLVLLALTSVIKMVAEHRVGNRNLSRPQRISFYLIIVYWLCFVVSMLFSSDKDAASRVVELKAVVLVFPLSFLLTDTQYLTRRMLRMVMYALVAGTTLRMLYYTGNAVVGLVNGSSLASVTSAMFDPRHHAYSALYAVCALAFIYCELLTHWGELRTWLRVVLIVLIPLLMLYVILVNSRAGCLAMDFVGLMVVAVMAFWQKRWWPAVVLGVLLVGYTVGMGEALPGHTNRLKQTLADLRSDDPNDARLGIMSSAMEAVKKSPMTGAGAGDYREGLVDAYEDADNEAAAGSNFNAHNQYMETLLAIGLLGCLPFLAMLLMPWVLALLSCRREDGKWRIRGDTILLVSLLTFVVMFNLLFESMLERQMGLQFIGLIYAVMILIISKEQNKFGQVTEK